MSTPVTPQTFRDAAAWFDPATGNDDLIALFLAAAEQGEQLERYKQLALDQDRRLLQKAVTITTPLWGAVTKARLEAERDEARKLHDQRVDQIATLTADVFATKTAMDSLQNELAEARTALAQAVEQIRVLRG